MTEADEAHPQPDASPSTEPAAPSRNRFDKRAAIAIALPILAALIVRIIYLAQIQSSVLTTIVFGDARSYDSWAQNIAAGDWVGSEVFYQAPAYPYFLAIVYSIFGHEFEAVRIVQIALGSIACGLLAYATRQFFTTTDDAGVRKPGNIAGAIAGLMLALYPPAIFFDGIIQKASLGLLLLCAMLACVASLVETPRKPVAIAAGVLLALLALTRENALIFAPVVIAWLAWQPHRESRNWKSNAALAGLFVAGILIVLLPIAARNASVGGGFSLTTSQLGPNLYIGNGAKADGTYKPLVWGGGDALVERHDAKRLAEQAVGSELSWAGVSDYWRDRTFDEIDEAPGRWFGLLVTKTRLLVNHVEIADTEAQQVYEDLSPLLSLLSGFWGFGPVLILGVLGAALTATQWRRNLPLYLLILSYAAAVVIFYVMARYRFPLAPLLMPLAAGGIAALYQSRNCLKPLLPQLGVGIAAAAILGFLSYQSLPQTDGDLMRALTYSNTANVLAQKDEATAEELEQAVGLYDDAITAQPRYVKAYNGRGIALAKLGNIAEAAMSYREAISLNPAYADAMFNLAVLLERTGNLPEAEGWYRNAIEAEPTNVEAYVNLGRLLAVTGQLGPAIDQYRKALAIEGHNAAAWNNMGTALARQGNLREAAAAFQKAVQLDPDYAEAQFNLAQARRMLQEPD